MVYVNFIFFVNTESCQVLSESCQVEDKCILEEEVVETVEQRESNLTEEVSNDAERCSPIGSPHLLKLTKSESVESYEPECDQECVSLNQDFLTCNKTRLESNTLSLLFFRFSILLLHVLVFSELSTSLL
jgi:hypothetical protein